MVNLPPEETDANVSSATLLKLVRTGQIERLRQIIITGKHNVDASVTRRRSKLLHYACYCENHDMVKMLLENGANVNIKNAFAYSPLFYANNLEIARLLFAYRGNAVHRNYQLNIPLHNIIKFQSNRLIDLHIQHEAHPLTFNEFDITPFLYACEYRSAKIVKYLVKIGAPVEFRCERLLNGFHVACLAKSMEVVKFLVTKIPDIDINEQCILGRTPLHIACGHNDLGICKILLQHNAETIVFDNDEQTPLCYALRDYKPNLITFLLYNNSYLINDRNSVKTFLKTIMRYDNLEFVRTISLCLFLDNISKIDQIIEEYSNLNAAFVPYLIKLKTIDVPFIPNCSSFINFFRATDLSFANSLRNDNYRRAIKKFVDEQTPENDPLFQNFWKKRYACCIRKLLYILIEERIGPSAFSIVNKILNFVQITEIANFTTALGFDLSRFVND